MSFLFLVLLFLQNIFSQTVPQVEKPAQKTLSGIQLSETLYEKLAENEFPVKKQPLFSYAEAEFPENIILTFPADTSLKADSVTNLVFAFTQEYINEIYPAFLVFLLRLKDNQFPFTIEILLSANDYSVLPASIKRFHKGGTEFFISTLEEPEKYCAVVIEKDTNQSDYYELITGNAEEISPSYLVTSFKDSCKKNSSKKLYSTSLHNYYRNSFFKTNPRLNSFLKEGIGSLCINSFGTSKDFKILIDAAVILSRENKNYWDKHYSFMKFGETTICLSEKFSAIFYIVLAVLSLFILCYFSFIKPSTYINNKHAVEKTIYILPELILLTLGTLYASDAIFKNQSLEIFFYTKIYAALFLPLILISVQLCFTHHNSYYAYSFLTALISLSQIFIFCTIEISFIYLFFLEFLFVLISQDIENPYLIFFCICLQAYVFINYISDFKHFATPEGLEIFLKGKLSTKLLLSLILFSFQMQFLKILLSLKFFIKGKKFFYKVSHLVIAIILLILFMGLLIFIFNRNKKQPEQPEKVLEPMIYFDEGKNFSVQTENSSFMELTTQHITVTTDRPYVRFNMIIKSEDLVPLYDCNFDFQLEKSKEAFICLPDFPGKSFEVVYSTDSLNSSVEIEAYCFSENNRIIRQHETIYLKSIQAE